jgi:hypothetical protein
MRLAKFRPEMRLVTNWLGRQALPIIDPAQQAGMVGGM